MDVGVNSVVDRGSWRDTVIDKGAMLDTLVHVGQAFFRNREDKDNRELQCHLTETGIQAPFRISHTTGCHVTSTPTKKL